MLLNQNVEDKNRTKLCSLLYSLFPAGVSIAGGTIEDGQGMLLPVEEKHVTGSGYTRQNEFRAGRTYARQALEAYYYSKHPIDKAYDRRPIWPAQIVGSISHSSLLCAVVIAPSVNYRGLGLDLELSTDLPEKLFHVVGNPEERSKFRNEIRTSTGVVNLGKIIFSAKESVFKAIYPCTLRWFHFHDVLVNIDIQRQEFCAVITDSKQAVDVRELNGRWAIFEDHVITAVAFPPNRQESI